MAEATTHVGFADESHWNQGRFRSLGLVSTRLDCLGPLEGRLRTIFSKSKISGEFKWNDVGGAKERFAACALCDFAIEAALLGQLRVDVLVWDIQDSRHNVAGRDDVANLQRMYYHLFKNVLARRWPDGAVWRLYPDEQTAIKWRDVQSHLENHEVVFEHEASFLTDGQTVGDLRREFHIQEVEEAHSHERPLLQLADLFAGMAAFSHEHFGRYREWLSTKRGMQLLPGIEPFFGNVSQRSEQRFQVLKEFDEKCKAQGLGVSLRGRKGLWTPRPSNPLNFWLYEAQSENDKAPTKR